MLDGIKEAIMAAYWSGFGHGALVTILIALFIWLWRTRMSVNARWALGIIVLLGGYAYVSQNPQVLKPNAPPPAPVIPPEPPRKPWRPWGTIGKITVSGPIAPDGKTEVQTDLPIDQRKHNVGGRDGAGLCVFTSIMHAARWQNELRLINFQDDMRKEPGGGYPEKVDRMIAKYGKGTQYLQYEGDDMAILKLALRTGRMPSVTYNGRDPHYRGSISHMVNLVYLDDKWACVLDNNFVGENELLWMTPAEFKSRWMRSGGWAVFLLNPPPPPPPHN